MPKGRNLRKPKPIKKIIHGELDIKLGQFTKEEHDTESTKLKAE